MRVLDSVAAADPELNVRSFVRHLRAANLAPTTIEVYGDAARQLTAFLAEAATATNRLRALQQFFKWLHGGGGISIGRAGDAVAAGAFSVGAILVGRCTADDATARRVGVAASA